MEVKDETFKRLIKRKFIKERCCTVSGGFVKYNGHIYYVDLQADKVVKQSMYKK